MQDIDQVMASHPAVEVARSFYRPDRNNQLYICVAVRFQRGEWATVRDLRRHARRLLPKVKVPVKYFYVANLDEHTDRGLLGVANLKKFLPFDKRKLVSHKKRQTEVWRFLCGRRL